MEKSLKDRWARLTAMTGGEMLDRARQNAIARMDTLRYRTGNTVEVPARAARTPARFFFEAEDVVRICTLLRQRLPQEVEAILRRAEKICQHRFDLLGYEDLNYGAEIDWCCDHVHGKRAPLKPFHKLRYLDFSEVGDVKVTWELNRHQHLVILAIAYRLTGIEKYAIEVFQQWRDWHTKNPYPIGINWASSLEVAFRSLSWLWMYFLMGDCPTAPRGFRQEWVRALGVNGRHIEIYLSTYFSPNTHLLGEATALFFIGTMCPELECSHNWKDRGWEIVLQEAERQVHSDGLHFEQSTYYHVYALDFFIHAAVLASKNDVSIPKKFYRTLEKMLNILCTLSRAGSPPKLGDDDGGRVFDPRRNCAEHLCDPLATGAVLFARGDFKHAAGGLRGETMWLLGEQGVADFDRLESMKPAQPPRTCGGLGSNEERSGGLYVMDHPETRQQLVIDAGPLGSLAGGHGHADALSVTLNSEGKALLIDSGTFEYVGMGPERNLLRGTSAHNTMTIDGLSQAEPKGPFAWGKRPNVKAEAWINGQMFDLFVGGHDGYARLLNPVVHRRWVFSLKSRFWLIRDMAEGNGAHEVDLFWHLNPELLPRKTPPNTANVFLSKTASTGLSLLSAEQQGLSRRIDSADWSPVYGKKETHPVLHVSANGTLPLELATVLTTDSSKFASPCKFWRLECSFQPELVQEYCYEEGGEIHHMFFGKGRPWMQSGWRSDAEFLYWSQNQGESDRRLICCNCTYLELNGESVVSHERLVTRCEIITGRDRMDIFPENQKTSVNKRTLLNALNDHEPLLVNANQVGSAHPKATLADDDSPELGKRS